MRATGLTRFIVAVAIPLLLMVASGGPGFAQVSTAPIGSGIGVTSPLGMGATSPLAPGPVGPVGIPMGATELVPGGVSPAPGLSVGTMSCTAGSFGSSTGFSGTSTFDGGGVGSMAGTSSASTSGILSSCAPVGGTASGTTTPSVLPGATAGSGGGIIPLGATELNSNGVSPMIGVPAPSVPAPCSLTAGTASAAFSSGSMARFTGSSALSGC